MLTHAKLLEILHYDPLTGHFVWKTDCPRLRVGQRAGTLGVKGYRTLTIGQSSYREHRLAWFYMTGEWPSDQVDHDNRVRNDNRWSNLKAASNSENQENTGTLRDGLKGAYKTDNPHRPWRGLITTKGRRYHLGYFATEEQAHAAYVEAKRKHHKFQGEHR